MNDLISRQAAITTLCERRCGNKPKGCPSGFCTESLAVDCIPSAEPRWIPITERPPVIENNVGKRVLVTTSWGMVGEAMYCKDHWEIHDISYQIKSVIAWMPLPEPWKEESDDE